MPDSRFLNNIWIILAAAAGFLFTPVMTVHSQTNFTVLTLRNGRVLTNAVMKKYDVTDVTFFVDPWNIKIPLSNCPFFLQKMCGYDATNAVAVLAAKAENKRKAAAESAQLYELQRLQNAIKVEFDKFDKYYTYSALQYAKDGDLGLEGEAYCFTRDFAPEANHYTLHLISQSREWRFLEYHRLVILSDGDTWETETEHKGDALHGGVIEQFFIKVKPSDFARWANAKSFEGKLGAYQFQFSYKERQGWRDLINYIAAQHPPDTNTVLQPVDLKL